MLRVEEIKKRLEAAQEKAPGTWYWQTEYNAEFQEDEDTLWVETSPGSLKSVLVLHPDYVIEDAVKDLVADAPSDISFLLQENERLQEALQFYVDEENWKMDLTDVSHNNLVTMPPAELDKGKKARQALGIE